MDQNPGTAADIPTLESKDPTPHPSPSRSDDVVTSVSNEPATARADNEIGRKERENTSPQSSSSTTRLIEEKDVPVSENKSNSPSTATTPSDATPSLEKSDKIPEANNLSSNKQKEPNTITPIKGKVSPKPNVIKVTERKESENDTYSKTNITPEDQKMNGGNSRKNNNDSNKDNNNSAQREDSSLSNSMSPKHPGSRRVSVLQRQKTYLRLMRNEGKTSDIAKDVCKMFSVLFAVGVRSVLFGFCMFTIWLVVYRLQNDYYYLLAISLVFLILETLHTVVKRAGQERKWFCLCFLCYLITTVPCIWILEIDRLNEFQSSISNATTLEVNVAGLTTDVTLSHNTLLAVTEQCLIFLLILCRWLLPRGDITRDQLSQLLFVYIGMASDVMELFTLFDESSVREDRTLTYIVLGVWSLSLLQFTLVLTMSRNPKKVRTAMDHDNETERIKRKRLRDTSLILVLTQSELWSLCISIFMQDGPFLAVRIFTLVKYNLLNYTIIFFVCKNILVILLLLYRVLILMVQKWEDKKNRDADVDGDDAHSHDSKLNSGRHRSKTVSTHLSLSDMEDERKQYTNSEFRTSQMHSESDGLRPRQSNTNRISPA